jgi:predicted  nucleic acid-binding Zn-ribbon protein
MNQAFQLYQLQKIDSQLDTIENRLSEIARILVADETREQAETAVHQKQQEIQLARLSIQKLEDVVQAQKIKVETSIAALYGGKISNPKELQDLQNEVGSLKKYLANLEDQELEAMISFDQLDLDLKKDMDNQKFVQSNFAEKQSRLLGEQLQLNRTKEKLLAERNATVPSILPENLDFYLKLRKTKRGIAVASITDGACTGCGSTLTPAEWQAARSPRQVVYCSSCGRILYAG